MPSNYQRYCFYALLLILGLIQAAFTELHDDEAYYWVYSRFPDWGYYDHPPMIAWLIRGGYWLFPNELGVRLFPLLLNIATLLLLEKLVQPRNPKLFYTILLSIAALQLMGFAAVPDIPLLFFAVLFFLCYKNFLGASSLKNTFCLGIAAALLLYSKYHGVLILFFTLLSHPQLLRNYRVYLAGLMALLLYLPHLYWQYQHDWVSFRYQLFESNVNPYRVSFTLDYLLGQLLIAGPLAGILLIPAALLYRPADRLSRAMRFNLLGIFIFFLASSFRGRVEANWTLPLFISMIVLAYYYLEEKPGWRRILQWQLPVTLLLVMAARIVMIADILPLRFAEERYHGWKEWPATMKKITGGLPVVFSSSYQRASKYWFYTGQPAFSLNYYKERTNNYNSWPLEDSLLGKPVYFLDKEHNNPVTDSIPTPIGFMGYRFDSMWASFARVQIDVTAKNKTLKPGDSLTLQCRASIQATHAALLRANPGLKTNLRLAVFNRYRWLKDIPLQLTVYDLLKQPDFSVTLDPALEKGRYFLLLAIQSEPGRPTHNSHKIKIMVR